jgi:hypothetical protein
LFDDTASTEPPAGAAPLSAAVQFDTPPEFNDVGVQLSPVIVTGATSVIDAVFVDPFRLALTVAVPPLVIVPAVAGKLALVAPAAAVTDAGTVRFALFDDTASTEPPAGAAPLSAAVQFDTPPEFNDVGVQLSPVTVTGGGGARTVTVPLTPVSGTVVADGVAPTTPTTSIVAVAEAVTSMMATTPSGIVVWLKPVSKHIYVPVPALQLMLFPAPLAAAPIFAFIAEIAAAGNCRVHCKADGAIPVGDVSVRFKLTGLPALVLADDNASVPDCPNTGDSARAKRTKYRIDI